jgi:protein SCO1/2
LFLKLLLFCLTFNFAQAYVPSTEGGAQNNLPEAIEGVGIDENLNTQLPGDLTFKNEMGEPVQISSFYSETKPVILSLVYYSCPSLCNLHLKGVFEVFNELGLTPGKDFEFLAVSIDETEKPDLAAAKKDTYVSEFLKDVENPDNGIHFLTGTKKNINKLADTVGFKFKWNEEANEWAHASAAIISTPQGMISRYLHGVYFDPKTFRLSVVEASKGEIGSLTDNFALFCFRYDPKTNKYAFYIMNILRGAAALILLILLAWLVPFWLKSRKTAS